MKTRTRALSWAGIAIVLVSMMWSATASADPRCWGENGLVVRPMRDVYTETATARSADGHTLLVWSDARIGSFDLYAQLYNAQGEPLWGAGVPVVQHAASQILPAACAVQGGWVVAWIDMRDNTLPWYGAARTDEEGYTGGNIRAQKLNEQGAHVWDDIDPSGVPVYSMTTEPDVIQIVAENDGAGGALVAWRNDSYNRLGAQRIAASGIAAWAAPLLLTDTPNNRSELTSCGDSSGNMLVGWREFDHTIQNYAARVTKISPAGTLPWGSNGRIMAGNFQWYSDPKLCSDGADGCFVGWIDYRTRDADIYAQHLDSAGNSLWADSGVAVCTVPNLQQDVSVATSQSGDGKDGMLLVWLDSRTSGAADEIYGQKLRMDGSAVWAMQGRKISGDSIPGNGTYRQQPVAASDGQGGLVCAWKDYRNSPSGDPTIFANRIRTDSSLAWQGAAGVPASRGISGGNICALWANTASATCVFYTTASDADYGLRRQTINLADGARQMPPEGATLAAGLRFGLTWVGPASVTMAAGRTALLWTDQRSVSGERVYLQIVDTAGHFEKDALGTKLLPREGGDSVQFSQQNPAACSDGNGGFFAVVLSNRTNTWQLRAMHVNAQGALTSDSSGRALDVSTGDQGSALCVPDGQGGCYVAWSYYNADWLQRTRLTRLNTACDAVWSVPLEFGTTSTNDHLLYGLAPNPDGGCTIISGDYSYGDVPTRLLITRVGTNRSVLWQRAMDFGRGFITIRAVEDRLGGLFVLTYSPAVTGATRELSAHHLNERGEDNWGPRGLTVAADSVLTFAGLRVAADDQLNMYIMYMTYRNLYDVTVQKITASGARVWGDHGLLLTQQATNDNVALCADGRGGAMAVWQGSAPSEWWSQLRGAHINASGAPTDPYWAGPDGGTIFPPMAWYINSVLTTDNLGGFVVACGARWPTEATYSAVLFAQRFAGGPLTAKEAELVPHSFALHQNYPNPFNPTTEIAFDIPRTERVKLTVFDVLGRHVQTLVDEPQVAGTHRVRFDGSALASGIYFYRLEAGEFRAVKKMVMVK